MYFKVKYVELHFKYKKTFSVKEAVFYCLVLVLLKV